MCGIAGILTAHLAPAEIVRRTEAMTLSLQHRGPDDSGVDVVCREGPVVVLGHRRLSIIDTSPAGHQPMHDVGSGASIVFNGEIYNYRELRRELEKLGRVFRTQTDTEVLLAAYAQWKAECLSRLRGIFAFAIWDPQTHSLFLARDQLGVKPLYYWTDGETLVFGSEVRALLASNLVPRDLDVASIGGYLAFGSVQDPQTLVRGVKSVLPGHYVTCSGGHSKEVRYWSLPVAADEYDAGAVNSKVAAALLDATASQLEADVPLGAFLSGGIDSTAVVALMQQAVSRPVRTFSIVFEESEWDEREFSRLAARHIGTEHTELLLTGEDIRASLAPALAAFDQPSVDGLNTYFVSKVTKESGLTVALSGVGGDEVFGGYDGYRRPLLAERWGGPARKLPMSVRKGISGILRHAPVPDALHRYGDLIEANRAPYFASRQLFGAEQIRHLLGADIAATTRDPETFARLERETSSYDPINRAAAFELQTYMLSTLLRDADQMSMAHALEVRVPLIDHRLVELMFTIPGNAKIRRGQPKPLLTLPLGDALPHKCVHRPKRGFELPFARWLKGSLESEMRDVFLGGRKGGPFEPKALGKMWASFEQGHLGWSRVWAIFVASNWLDRQSVTS